jgi:thiamine pyrophosphokinase
MGNTGENKLHPLTVMRAVIISGGAVTDGARIKSLIGETDLIICADSGYDHAVSMEIKPDAVVGDMDSVMASTAGVETIKYPPDKDFTDTELAVNTAIGRGADELLLLGCTGGRIDHTIANIMLLRQLCRRGIRAEIADEQSRIFLIDCDERRTLELQVPVGTTVSLIPLRDCAGVNTVGLKYPLRGEALPSGCSRGVSNVIQSAPASVTLDGGTLLIILTEGDLT